MGVDHSTYNDDEIAWHENQIADGGFFGSRQVIVPFLPVDGPHSVYAADLEGDGDLDVLSASEHDDKIAWYENEGGGSFGAQQVITTQADAARSVYAADLDGDGDLDILSAGADKIAWYENTISFDQRIFSEGVVTTQAGGATSVYAADLDGDGDPDVLSASAGDDKIAWYENTDDTLPVELAGFEAVAGEGAVTLTWTTVSETNNAGFHVERRAGETDGWTEIGFVEGAGTTAEAQTYRFTDAALPYGAKQLTYRLVQVDTDGSATVSEAVAVRRGVERAELRPAFPNPARSQVTVRYAVPEGAKVTLRLYDVLGRMVRTLARGSARGRVETQLDVSGLPSGVYFLRLQAGGETLTRRLTVVR